MHSVYYNKLDHLQSQIFDQLNELIGINQNEDIDDTRVESSKVVKKLNKELLTYKDYLIILKSKIGHNKEEQVLYNRYESKFVSLKSKARDLHLYSNDLNNEIIHKQRITRFSLDKIEPENQQVSDEVAREQLFANRSKKLQESKELSLNQQILQQNKQITSSLQTSKQLLSASVLQSELNIDSLDQQTKDLHKLNEDFLRFSDLLNKSKQIVKFIEKQDKADRRRIYLSVGFFLLCCAWVIYKRILRMPLRILFWSFFKIFRIFNWIFVRDGSVQQMGTEQLVSGILATTVLSSILGTEVATTVETSISSALESSIDLDNEFVMDIDSDLSILESLTTAMSEIISSTLSEIVSTATERIIDEL
ncbi:Sec20-domain-containing protein [Scheffersomyces xylosifermentans]|uniref:Sec20-domain-containing protein n=1 Tax=Scheffersomyces xylosifermentans TaxID=1304137 RepID=UPI00315DE7BA